MDWQASVLSPAGMSSRDRSDDLAIAAAFGRRVREVRMDQEMTQEALAEAAGLHPTFISNVERGYRVPSLVTVLRLADGLDVAPGELVDEVDVVSKGDR